MSNLARGVAFYIVLALGGAATPVHAVEVVATFSGSVTSITDSNAYLPDDVVLTAPVSGRFQYQTLGSSVTFPGSDYAAYTFADGGMSIVVTVGSSGWSATTPTDAAPNCEIRNDHATLRDEFRLTAGTPVVFPAALGVSLVGIALRDASAPYQMLADLDLPLTSTDLAFAAATIHAGTVSSTSAPNHWQFMFNITMLTFEPLAVQPRTWSAVKRLFE